MPESTEPERGRRELIERDRAANAGKRRDATRAKDRTEDR
jgi:hypothetical protein